MIRVMIVEDEPPILRSIKLAIETENVEFEVVACAGDGDEALQLIDTAQPDVIFTDIRMPVMSGIDLLAKVKVLYPDIITIIISGYQDFEYAKKAMQYGALNYLLKPVSVNELSELLHNISQIFNDKLNGRQRLYMDKALNDNILDGSKNVSVKFDNSCFFTILLCAGSFINFSMDYFCPAKDYWNEFSLEETASHFLVQGEKVWLFDGKSGSEKVLIFGVNEFSNERADILAKSIYSALPVSRFSITLIVSRPFYKYHEIGIKMQFMRSKLNAGIIIGHSQIILESAIQKNDKQFSQEIMKMNSIYDGELELYLKNGNIVMFKSGLNKVFKKWGEIQYPQILVEKMIRQIISLVSKYSYSTSYDHAMLELSINEAISSSYDLSDLFNNLWYIFEEILGVSDRISGNDSKALMQKIDKFICANITEPINNNILSEKFGLVPTYLSKLFRDYKGSSPYEYLTSLRIEKAIELMKSHPDMLTKDVAELVGYSDPLHFSKIFKRKVKLTPSEFKIMLQGKTTER